MQEAKKIGGKSRAAWANIVLIPVKQHFFCCGVLPVAVSAFGGAGAAEFLHTPEAEIGMFLTVPPIVTYGVMYAEQKLHDYKHRRREKRNALQHCATENAACMCAHKTLTTRNLLKQTGWGYLFYAGAYMLLPHTHDHERHSHDHLHDHPHEHHKGCGHDHAMSDSVVFRYPNYSAWDNKGYILL